MVFTDGGRVMRATAALMPCLKQQQLLSLPLLSAATFHDTVETETTRRIYFKDHTAAAKDQRSREKESCPLSFFLSPSLSFVSCSLSVYASAVCSSRAGVARCVACLRDGIGGVRSFEDELRRRSLVEDGRGETESPSTCEFCLLLSPLFLCFFFFHKRILILRLLCFLAFCDCRKIVRKKI